MAITRPKGYADAVGNKGSAAPYGAWEKTLPAFCAAMCDRVWDDGTERRPWSFSMWTGEGLWTCCVTDKLEERIAFVTAPCPAELFKRLEAKIKEGRLDWRIWRPPEPSRTKRAGQLNGSRV